MPQFVAGETLRYRIESRDMISGKTTGPIANPEGGTRSTQSIHIVVRLDVVGAVPGAAGVTRIRATCEESSAESQGDALDLTAANLADRYKRMQGHPLEFIVQPGGQVVGVQGSDPVFGDSTTAGALLSWLGRISYGAVPRRELSRGEKWKSERPLPDAALLGLTWHTESSYIRDEPCGPSATALVKGECAVVSTHFQISRSGSATSDATPEQYRHNGLRTAGKWSGGGESEDSISLAGGILVRSTQTSTQDLDYKVTSVSTGSSIHHVGSVESTSEVTLVPPDSPTAR